MSLYSDLIEVLTPYAQKIKEKADKSMTYTKIEVDALISEVGVETDTTLGVSGAPADSAETGRQIGLIKADLDNLDDKTYEVNSAIRSVNSDYNELIDGQFLKSEPTNLMPHVETFGGIINAGTLMEDTRIHTEYVPVAGGVEYTIALVPAFGAAVRPWFTMRHGINFYDSEKQWISEVTPTSTGRFTTPIAARYMIVNLDSVAGISAQLYNSRCMLVKGNMMPETYSNGSMPQYYDYPGIINNIGTRLDDINEDIAGIDSKIHFVSNNLYDKSLQTDETISPHYFVNGVPYSSTQYDNEFHCVDFIEVEPSTQYALGYVPAVLNVVKPWESATQGLFFYNSNKEYISMTISNVFTTPSNCKYIRFNWALANNKTLDVLNSRCMLVKADSLPNSYSSFYDYYADDAIKEIEKEIQILEETTKINYIIDNDGNGVTLISKYNGSYDIAIGLKKKGGNNLFDFNSIGLIPNQNKKVSNTTAGITYLLGSSGDWHSPFIIGAVNNTDGDSQSKTFTGGNHQYNNESGGSTATARTSSLKFISDGMIVNSGSGSCSRFEMIWTNFVQGYNTKKTDGTGREIISEKHKLIFDGVLFDDYVFLVPSEDVYVERWYGYQWFTSNYPNTVYVGGTNRGTYNADSAGSSSGDTKCCFAIGYSTNHEIRVDADENYDLGDHKYYQDTEENKAIFTVTYGKGYFNFIKNTNLYNGNTYALHGHYQFTPHN